MFGLFKSDETKNWKTVNTHELLLNLNNSSVNNLKIDDSDEKVKMFGKPDNENPFKNEKFDYKNTGLIIETENKKVNYFGVIIGIDTIVLQIQFGEQRIKISKDSIRTDLINFLNLNIESTDKDDSEIIDFIKHNNQTFEIESDLNETIKRVNLYHE